MAKLRCWDDSKLATVRSLSLAAQGAKAFTAAPCGGSGSLNMDAKPQRGFVSLDLPRHRERDETPLGFGDTVGDPG